MHGLIDTDKFSSTLRDKSVDTANRKLLITRLGGSEQEADFTVPANCGGLGRIRHFNRATSAGWPPNPLPIDSACRALKLSPTDSLRVQVFQNASCNWRCWYCYVPFPLLNADPSKSEWVTPGELIDCYLQVDDRPSVIDLTGGQPDLVPEWVPWMMEELQRRGMQDKVYLWSDDNLSNDYFWRYLSTADHDRIVGYRNYGKVCCFKGFDTESFKFNTSADGSLFAQQFELISRYVDLGLDVFGYATFTTPTKPRRSLMAAFVDRLQKICPNLPLRVVPLEVQSFSPVAPRTDERHNLAMNFQHDAVALWNGELAARFTEEARTQDIATISLSREINT